MINDMFSEFIVSLIDRAEGILGLNFDRTDNGVSVRHSLNS